MLRLLTLALLLCLPISLFAETKVEPARPATEYPAHITQAGVTVAADPYDRDPKAQVFRVDYLQYDFLPIRIVVTNDTAHPISLDDARILLMPAEGDKVNAGEAEDVERRVSGAARHHHPYWSHLHPQARQGFRQKDRGRL